MNFLITKNGKKLKKSLYTWDKDIKVLQTEEIGLVLNFSGINNVTFKTGSRCIFITGYGCIFNTGSYCNFKTSFDCRFITGSDCMFDASYGCDFVTGSRCTFNAWHNVMFKTGSECIFKTTGDCIFDTMGNCVIIRRGTFEVIKIPENTIIKLNKEYDYTVVSKKEIITIDNKRYYKKEVKEKLKELKLVK